MSLTVARWASTPGIVPPTDFLARFERTGAALRRAWAPDRRESSAYLATVLRVGLRSSALLLVVEGPDGDVARAAAFRGGRLQRVGMLGLYEAEGGPLGDAATEEIVAAVLGWAAEQGMEELYAPVDVNTWFTYRFVVADGAASSAPRSFGWEPDQPEEYPERFRGLGFETAETFETIGFDFPSSGAYTVQDFFEHTRRGFEIASDSGFRFERLRGISDFDGVLQELHPMCMEAFGENPLFEPLPQDLFNRLYHQVLAAADGHLTFLARDERGRLTGFVFAFPDRGWVVVKTIAVAAAARGRWVSSALLHSVARAAIGDGYHRFVSALVRVGNKSAFLLDPHRMPSVDRWVRRYELLRRDVAP